MADVNKQMEFEFVVKDGKAIAQLKKFENELNNTSKAGRNLGGAVQNAATSGRKLGGAAKGAASGMKAMGAATKRTNIAMMNAGRLIEDSAFGLRGMSNNITPALTSFNALKKELGSTSKALGVMAKGMLTATGAVSVIVPILITLALVAGPKLAKALGKGDEAAKKFKDRMKEVAKETEEATLRLRELEEGEYWSKINVDLETARKTLQDIDDEIADINAELQDGNKWLEGQGTHAGRLKQLAKDRAKAEEDVSDLLELQRLQQEAQLLIEQNRTIELAQEAAGYTEIEKAQYRAAKAQTELNRARGNQNADPLQIRRMENQLLQAQLRLQIAINRARKEELTEFEADVAAGLESIAPAAQAATSELDLQSASIQQLTQSYEQLETAIRNTKLAKEEDNEVTVMDVFLSMQAMKAKEFLANADVNATAAMVQNAEARKEAIKSTISRLVQEIVVLQVRNSLMKGGALTPFGMAKALASGLAAGVATRAILDSVMPSARQGVTNFGGGVIQVHKDEIISLPPGSDVLSQARSRQATRGGGGGMMPEVKVVVSGDMTSFIDKVDIESQRNGRAHVGSAAAFTR